MYIGKAALLSEVSNKTIRHYDNLGLLGEVKREGKYRVFATKDIRLIKIIKLAQSMGFKLAEIKAMLDHLHQDSLWQGIATLLQNKQESIDSQIQVLKHQKDQLQAHQLKIEQCLRDDPDCVQPVY